MTQTQSPQTIPGTPTLDHVDHDAVCDAHSQFGSSIADKKHQEELAQHPCREVRQALAKNTFAWKAVLNFLAEHETDPEVLRALAQNLEIPRTAFNTLKSRFPNGPIARALQHNPKARLFDWE